MITNHYFIKSVAYPTDSEYWKELLSLNKEVVEGNDLHQTKEIEVLFATTCEINKPIKPESETDIKKYITKEIADHLLKLTKNEDEFIKEVYMLIHE